MPILGLGFSTACLMAFSLTGRSITTYRPLDLPGASGCSPASSRSMYATTSFSWIKGPCCRLASGRQFLLVSIRTSCSKIRCLEVQKVVQQWKA